MVLTTSFTWAWQETWSWLSGVGMSVGPKQMAKLYGSIMFSSLYWDRLGRQETTAVSEGGTQGGAHGFVNLLVQKGEQVAHHHEDGSGKRQQDLPNVQRPLVEVLYPYKNNTTVRNLRHVHNPVGFLQREHSEPKLSPNPLTLIFCTSSTAPSTTPSRLRCPASWINPI